MTVEASSRPSAAQPAGGQTEPSRGGSWRVFAGVSGGPIRVTCAHDRLVTLKGEVLSGCRLRPAVADISGDTPVPIKMSTMDWNDAGRVDLAMLEQAAGVLAPMTWAPMFVIPASFSTLSSQRGRRQVLEQVQDIVDRFHRKVTLEIRDLRGVPASRLAEVIAILKPACHGVIGEVEPDRMDIAAVSGCGLNGLSVRPRRDWTADARATEHFTGLGELARRVAPVALTRAFTRENFPILAKAGFTHATIGAEAMPVVSAAAA